MARRNYTRSGGRRLFNMPGATKVGNTLTNIGEGMDNLKNVYDEAPLPAKNLVKSVGAFVGVDGNIYQAVSGGLKLVGGTVRKVGGGNGPARPAGPYKGRPVSPYKYLRAKFGEVKIFGKGRLLRGKNMAHLRLVQNHSHNHTGTVYGHAHWSSTEARLSKPELIHAMQNLFGSGSTGPTGTINSFLLQPTFSVQITDFHNIDRVTAFMTIYECLASCDMPENQVEGGDSPGGNDVLSVLTRSQSALRWSTASGTLSIEDLDMTPSNSYFKKFWRVMSVKRVALEPGTTYRHVYIQKGYYPCRETKFVTGNYYFKGISKQTLLRFESAPVRDSGAAAPTKGTPDVISTTQSKCFWLGELVAPRIRYESSELSSTIVGYQNVVQEQNPQDVLSGDPVNKDITEDPIT